MGQVRQVINDKIFLGVMYEMVHLCKAIKYFYSSRSRANSGAKGGQL